MILSLFYHNNTISLKVGSSRFVCCFLKIMEWIQVELLGGSMKITYQPFLKPRWSHSLGFFLLHMWLIMTCFEFSSINILVSRDLVWFVFNIRDLGWLYIQIEISSVLQYCCWKDVSSQLFLLLSIDQVYFTHSLMFFWYYIFHIFISFVIFFVYHNDIMRCYIYLKFHELT